jgi:hypothetical protein
MAQYYSGPISQLPPAINPVLPSNIYPATDITDLTESPSGTTYKYSISELQQYLVITTLGSNIQSALVATTGTNLISTYNNGTAGVGATLTNAGTLAALVIDSTSVVVGNRVLIKDQTLAYQNGVYLVTVAGSASAPWVLTRAPDYDGSIRTPMQGDFIGIVTGSVNELSFWFQVAPNPIIIGTSSILWAGSMGGSSSEWVTVAGTSQTVEDQFGYIPLNGSLTTFTLPAACPVGFSFSIEGLGNGGWTIQANGGQYLRFLSTVTNSGGTAASAYQYDGCHVVCVTANTEFKIITAGSSGLVLD